jgi:hypothetical protein
MEVVIWAQVPFLKEKQKKRNLKFDSSFGSENQTRFK